MLATLSNVVRSFVSPVRNPGLILILAFTQTLTLPATFVHGQSTVVYVDINNGVLSPPDLGQNGWGSDAYKFLQDALDAADELMDFPHNFDEVDIWVAQGMYRPDQGQNYTLGDREATFDMISNVAIIGHFAGTESNVNERDLENPAYETILSGDLDENDEPVIAHYDQDGYLDDLEFDLDSYEDNSIIIVMADGVNEASILDGFTIRGGYRDSGTDFDVAALVIRNDANPRFRNCVVKENYNISWGAASVGYNSTSGDVRFTDCTFERNYSAGGPVFINEIRVVLIGCTISDNYSVHHAGGVFVLSQGLLTMVNTAVVRNRCSERGGGVFFKTPVDGEHHVWNCLIARNQSTLSEGGGIAAVAADETGRLEILNSTIVANRTLNSFGNGYGGGLYVEAFEECLIRNSIFWQNESGESTGNQIASDNATYVTVYRSNIEGGAADGHLVLGDWPENPSDPDHSIDSDPQFVDAPASDYRLTGASPSKDAGDYDHLPCDDYDIAPGVEGIEDLACDNDQKHPIDLDGNARVMFGGIAFQVDHGAYEFQCGGDCLGDINDDGFVDGADLLILLSQWGPCLQGCTADLNCDGVVDGADLLILLSHWGECPPQTQAQNPPTLEDLLAAAGLTNEDWDEFVGVMMNGTEPEKENYLCWMENYLNLCDPCDPCPDSDPFAD